MYAAQLAGEKAAISGILLNEILDRSSAAEGLRQFGCDFSHEPPENRQTVVRNADALPEPRWQPEVAAIVVDHRGERTAGRSGLLHHRPNSLAA